MYSAQYSLSLTTAIAQDMDDIYCLSSQIAACYSQI